MADSARVRVVVVAAAALLVACGGAPAGAPDALDAAPAGPPPRVAIALRFVESIGPDPASVPSTRVVLVRIVEDGGPRTFDLGPFPGVCHNEPAPPPLLLRARCGWRGERAGVSVRPVDGGLLVRRLGALGPSFEGERERVRIELPPDAVVEVIAPPTLPVGTVFPR